MPRPEKTAQVHEESIRELIELGSGLDEARIYYRGQKGPKLRIEDGEYIIIDVGGHFAIGTPTRKLTTDVLGSGFKHVVTSCREGTVEIQVFGVNHRAIMETLTLAINSPAWMLREKELGISLEEGGQTITIDREDLDTIWDERSIKEFTYRFAKTYESEAVEINTLDATANVT